MPKKPKILITNDDGIHAPGIRTLWRSLADFADLTVVAPEREQSGMGLAITLHSPLHMESASWDGEKALWKVTGTPADCIRLALSRIMQEPPDLIVSGINRGDNSGRTIFYSGTVGGVIEGALHDLPGIAFSHASYHKPDYAAVQKLILPIVQHTLEHPLPLGTILNVNFPENEHEIKGVKLARQGSSYWEENPEERTHPEGRTYYWMGGKRSRHEDHPESDVALLKRGYATVVPLHVHALTDLNLLQMRKEGFERLF